MAKQSKRYRALAKQTSDKETLPLAAAVEKLEIGRASCRERV